MLSTLKYKVEEVYYGTRRFLKNLFVFRRLLLSHRDYDYSGIYIALHCALTDLEPTIRLGYHTNREKVVKRIRVCLFLLDRLIKDEYLTDKWNFIDDDGGFLGMRMEKKYDLPTKHLDYAINREKQDHEMLMHLLSKHMRTFWD